MSGVFFPLYWFLKKQAGTEISSFGFEIIAMKQCSEYICGLHYRLRMMVLQLVDWPSSLEIIGQLSLTLQSQSLSRIV